jgi:hypothetical protein
MKQRITVEQLNELTDDQKVRLREWWNHEDYDVVWDGENIGVMEYFDHHDLFVYGPNTTPRSQCLPLLSIGQMFQLLDDDRQSAVPVPISQILPNYHLHYTDSLCDVLWGAVKQILKY